MSDVLRFLGPVRERDFGLFWTARTMSILGDYVFRIAFITYLIGLTHSPAFVSAATATLLVPPLLFYLFGGAIADQVSSRRNIMITADLLRFGASAGIVIAVLLSPDPWLIVVLALVVSIGSGFFAPASFAFITEIVAKQRLVAANSALSISQQVGLIAGPLLGATLALAGGPAAAFAVDALTFLGSGLLLSRIRSSRRREPLTAAPRERLIGQLAGGLRYVIRTPWLVLSFAVGAVANAVFTGSLDVAVPLLLAPEGILGARGLGLFYALEGVGALVGALILGRLVVVRVSLPLFGMLAAMAGSLALAGALGRQPLSYATAVTYGVGMHFFNSLYHSLIQENVPDALMSRVGSVASLAFDGLMPMGALLMGPLVLGLGVGSALVVSGLAVSAISLAVLCAPSIRALTLASQAARGESGEPAVERAV